MLCSSTMCGKNEKTVGHRRSSNGIKVTELQVTKKEHTQARKMLKVTKYEGNRQKHPRCIE